MNNYNTPLGDAEALSSKCNMFQRTKPIIHEKSVSLSSVLRLAQKTIALLGFAFMMGWGQAEAALVRFNPTPTTVSAGSSFSLSLLGESFTSNLDGGGINLSYDPTVLSISSITFDPIWNFFTSWGTTTVGNQALTSIIFTTLNSVANNFAIGSIQFNAVGAGITSLAITESTENPFASGGDPLPVSLAPPASVTSTAAPNIAKAPLPLAANILIACFLASLSYVIRNDNRRKS